MGVVVVVVVVVVYRIYGGRLVEGVGSSGRFRGESKGVCDFKKQVRYRLG